MPMRQPRPGPGTGRELTVRQELACALRILAREGWRENLSGHITVAADDGGMWCNPWGLWWDEVRASDVVRLDAEGEVVDGHWDVTPAVFLHTELHRARTDATVIVHNHPYYATLLSTIGEPPVQVHQNSCIFDGELAFVDEYGGVGDPSEGRWLADQVGGRERHTPRASRRDRDRADHRRSVLQSHHVRTHVPLHLRRHRRGPQAGRDPHRCARPPLKTALRQNTPPAYWDGAVRLLLREQPEVLT